jgi:hypothetical protein
MINVKIVCTQLSGLKKTIIYVSTIAVPAGKPCGTEMMVTSRPPPLAHERHAGPWTNVLTLLELLTAVY